jgi:predicted GIY-YIG superfamily endonuclease
MKVLKTNTYIYSIRSDMIYHIYGLFNEDHPHTYIGHTKNINARLYSHRNKAKTKNSKVYKCMREVGGDWKMEVLETHECTKKYAKEREKFYKELMGDLNSEVPGGTREEWKKNNPEKVKAKWKRSNVKCKLNRYTCECGSNLRWSDRLRHEKSKSHLAYKNKD